MNELEETMLKTFHNKSKINTTAALEEAKQILMDIKDREFTDDGDTATQESKYVILTYEWSESLWE